MEFCYSLIVAEKYDFSGTFRGKKKGKKKGEKKDNFWISYNFINIEINYEILV